MARRLIAGVAFVAALVIAGYAVAHEGHVHKVMGTVITADGRTAFIAAMCSTGRRSGYSH